MSDEPRKPLYSRENLKPDTPLFREPVKPPEPDPTPEQIERWQAILDKLGVRILNSRIVTPVEPTQQMMQALASLRLDLPVLLLKEQEPMSLYYGLLEKGWLIAWEKNGWRGVEQTIRNNITLMA